MLILKIYKYKRTDHFKILFADMKEASNGKRCKRKTF